jgi:hypothetical protein
MLTALMGVLGIVIGAILAQVLTMSRDRRAARSDALVRVVTAAASVIAAHERLHELLTIEQDLDPRSEHARMAYQARTHAHAEWRAATARARILMPTETELHQAATEFGTHRANATPWVHTRIRPGTARDTSVDAQEHEAWLGMRSSRHALIAAAQQIAAADARLWPNLRFRSRNKAKDR